MKRKASIGRQIQKLPEPKKCIACNGSGYYDHNGSPPCGACEGSGLNNSENARKILDELSFWKCK